MVQRLAISAADEVGTEPFEEMVERPHPSPLPHRIGERDELEEHVGDQDVVGVGAMIDDRDDDRIFGRAVVEIAQQRALNDRLIEKVHDGPGDRRAEAVVRQQVELGNDLLQIGAGLPHRNVSADVMFFRVSLYGVHDIARSEDLQLNVGVAAL